MKHNIIFLMILAGLLGVSCDSLDVVGMFVSSGPSTEDRVEEWLAYNEANGMTVIDGINDELEGE